MANELILKLQALLNTNIWQIKSLNSNYTNTNDVYELLTEKGRFVIKILKDQSAQSLFWRGLNSLFGVTPEASISYQLKLSVDLNKLDIIPVPEVIQFDSSRNNVLQKPYIVFKAMAGTPAPFGSEMAAHIGGTPELTAQLGTFLAALHKKSYPFYGGLNGGTALEQFPSQIGKSIQLLASSDRAKKDQEVQKLLPYILSEVQKMPPPKSANLIMLKSWPRQFLATEQKLTALIGIEGYVIGPLGLELSLLELWIKKRRSFKEAYLASGLEWPEFEEQREVYRFYLYLLYSFPEIGLSEWLDAKKFAQGNRVRQMFAPRLKPRNFPPTNFGDDEDD